MLDHQLRSQAQAHNLEALQILIEQVLGGSTTRIYDLRVHRNCLQISLESDPVPEQAVAVPPLKDLITQLQIPDLSTVEIYGHRRGHDLPYWKESIPVNGHRADTPEVLSQPTMPETGLAWRGTKIVDPAQCLSSLPSPTNATAVTAKTAPDPTESSPAVIQLLARYAAGERDFPQVDLSHTELCAANLSLANLKETKWVWANLTQARLGRSDLTGADFRHATLSDANLQSAQLQGADFQGADLRGANLSWAELRGANFTGADLTDANLHQANLERVTMPDGTYLD